MYIMLADNIHIVNGDYARKEAEVANATLPQFTLVCAFVLTFLFLPLYSLPFPFSRYNAMFLTAIK